MALTQLLFESGSNGDTATTGNTGFDSIVATGGTLQISTAWAAQGTRSVALDATSTSGALYGQKTITTTSGVALDFDWYHQTHPSAEQGILGVYAAGTRCVSVAVVNATGQIRVRDGANANAWTSTAGMSTGTAYRISVYLTQNASTGTIRVVLYAADGVTVVADSGSLTGKNTGSAQYTNFRVGGKISTGTTTIQGRVDRVRYDEAATGLLPAPASIPPSLPGSIDLTGYGVWVDLSATTYQTGPLTFTASPSTGVRVAGSSIFLPAPADGSSVVYTVTATDTGNGTSTSTTVTVALPVSTTDVIETVVWSGSAWT